MYVDISVFIKYNNVAYLADQEELMSELTNQCGNVGNNGLLQQGEAAHDGFKNIQKRKPWPNKSGWNNTDRSVVGWNTYLSLCIHFLQNQEEPVP